MERDDSRSIADLLQGVRQGDPDAENRLFQIVYHEIKTIATHLMKRERVSHTLDSTAVLHEAYTRLFNQGGLDINDRQHLIRLATRSMKQVLVDHARKKNAAIRGGDRQRESLDLVLEEFTNARGVDVESLHDAMERLKATHPRAYEVVQLRFFGNHTTKEIAEILGVSERTAGNDWIVARARLRLLLQESD